MTIYRLSIEAIKGDDEGKFAELRQSVRETPGMVLYDDDAIEGWGVAFRPGSFNLDFDSTSADETDVDAAAFDKVRDFVLDRTRDKP